MRVRATLAPDHLLRILKQFVPYIGTLAAPPISGQDPDQTRNLLETRHSGRSMGMAGRASQGDTPRPLAPRVAVLRVIARRGEVRLAELAKELGTSRTTIFRVLETLRSHGFAEHVAERHTYRLAPGARSRAALATQSPITRLAEPPMADLRNATGETVNLIGVQGSRLVYEA